MEQNTMIMIWSFRGY